jgi:hypothetical protein
MLCNRFFKKNTLSLKKVSLPILFAVVFVMGVYLVASNKITISPMSERSQMQKLAFVKEQATLKPFVSDGCSGFVSKGWSMGVHELSKLFPSVDERYSEATQIPFEEACVKHDMMYHQGDGGYSARLIADNQLRSDIIDYGLMHTAEIKQRAQLDSDEVAIFMYEMIAEAVYRAVRLGGAPCSGQSYAWGYGYTTDCK